MYVSRPIPADRPTKDPSERGFVVALVLFAILLLSASLWFNQHDVSFAPCGEDLAAVCVLG